jgi:hypothetical protein
MRAHTLMQAIARANRIYPGKECGVIVDYNGMLRGLHEALAQYALGDEEDSTSGGLVAPIRRPPPESTSTSGSAAPMGWRCWRPRARRISPERAPRINATTEP